MRRVLPGRQQPALVAALLEHANAFLCPCPSAAHKTSHHSCSSQMHTDAFSLCICLSVSTCIPISLSSHTAGRCRNACSASRWNKYRNCLLFPQLYEGLVMHKTSDNSSIVLDDVCGCVTEMESKPTNKTSLILSPETSRFASADPNEQNTPVNTEAPGSDGILGKNARGVPHIFYLYKQKASALIHID